jgi:hypothetical protein
MYVLLDVVKCSWLKLCCCCCSALGQLQASGGIEVKGKGHMETYYFDPAAALSAAAQQQLQALLRKTRDELDRQGLQHCWSSNCSPTAATAAAALQAGHMQGLQHAWSSSGLSAAAAAAAVLQAGQPASIMQLLEVLSSPTAAANSSAEDNASSLNED